METAVHLITLHTKFPFFLLYFAAEEFLMRLNFQTMGH